MDDPKFTYTASLVNLPKITFSDVHRLTEQHSITARSKVDKGYSFFFENFIYDYEADAAELQETSCSCTAGKVLCNHLVALLFQSAHYSMLQVRAVPPPVACTGSLQTWHRPRTKDPSLTRKSCLLGKD
ncbi:unnamed protein product [Leuciscus chuanchicus]